MITNFLLSIKVLFILFAFCFSAISLSDTKKIVSGASDEVVLVANKENKINKLKKNELVRIYLRKTKKFSNGLDVIPVDLKSSDTRDVFYRDFVRRTERQLKYYWSRMMFSGNTRPPKKMRSDRAVINFVASNISAIGYVRADSVTNDVKIIKVVND